MVVFVGVEWASNFFISLGSTLTTALTT